MNIAILETERASQIATEIIEKYYNPWLTKSFDKLPLNVAAYVSSDDNFSPVVGDKTVLNFQQFAALYHQKLIDGIIFPREVYCWSSKALKYLQLLDVKVEDVYITRRLNKRLLLENFIEPYHSAKYLPYLEFHVADHCNLNCRGCSHYSGLVKEPTFPNLQKFTQDFERLHEFIDDIYTVRILGGEPLLNPELDEYIKLTRRLYPQAVICVVTNAILLPKMPESFFETLRTCNALIDISFYPPLESKMPAIKRLLEEKNIPFRISSLNKIFYITKTLNPHNHEQETFLNCAATLCNNIYDGKIATCCLPFMTKYFNAYYGKNLPENGALDLYDPNLTTEKLKAHLLKPFEICRRCTQPVAVEWTTIKYPSPITDWIND